MALQQHLHIIEFGENNLLQVNGRFALTIIFLFQWTMPTHGRITWFKVPLEKTKSGLGAEQLRGVIKYHEGTRTVEFDLSRPLFLD